MAPVIMQPRYVYLCIVLVCLFVLRAATSPSSLAAQAPSTPTILVLWAWERNEDLRFLADQPQVEVAAVLATVRLVGGQAYVSGRRQHLVVPANIRVTPVVHVDALSQDQPAFNEVQRRTVVAEVLAASRYFAGAAQPDDRRVQLDFEIAASHRPFYRQMIKEIRSGPTHLHLSVTALASWCVHDQWMAGLAVDEIVPMLFRMGADGPRIRNQLAATQRLPALYCGSVGMALDEPTPSNLRYPRVYLFNPRSWQPKDYFQVKTQFGTHTKTNSAQ